MCDCCCFEQQQSVTIDLLRFRTCVARWIYSGDGAIIGKNAATVSLADPRTGSTNVTLGSDIYALVGVVEHVGVGFENGGHYVAWLRIGNNYVRADDERCTLERIDSSIEVTLAFYVRLSDVRPGAIRPVPLVPPPPPLSPPRGAATAPTTPAAPTRGRQRPRTQPTNDDPTVWFDAPVFHGKTMRSFPARGTLVYTRLQNLTFHEQRNTVMWGRRPRDYEIDELADTYHIEMTFVGDIGGRNYLLEFMGHFEEGPLMAAIEVIPQLVSLVCGARPSRRSHVRHHESPYAKDASGVEYSVGYDSEATPIRNMSGAVKPNKHVVAVQRRDRQSLNLMRKERAKDRADRLSRAARAPRLMGNSVTNASSGVSVPVVPDCDQPARCSRQRYHCPPVGQLISVMLTRTKRASNALDHCEAFSDSMMHQRVEFCPVCNEQWWKIDVQMGACRFCRKTRGTTGSYPWKASNLTDAHDYRVLLHQPPPPRGAGLRFGSDLEKEGCRLLQHLTLGEQVSVLSASIIQFNWIALTHAFAAHRCSSRGSVQ